MSLTTEAHNGELPSPHVCYIGDLNSHTSDPTITAKVKEAGLQSAQ